MNTRKLQRVGGGTYTVSIPKEWAERHGLEAGVDVHLYTHDDGSIVLRGSERDGGHLDEAVVEFEAPDPTALERSLVALHAAGFETVTLSAPGLTDADRRALRSAARSLVGAEVVEVSEGRARVRTLLDAANVSVPQSVVQLQYVALSIHRRATAALVDAEDGAHVRLAERDDEADRLFAIVSRHFNRSLSSFEELDNLGTSRPELFDYHVTARQLERVADHGVGIADLADDLGDQPPPDVAADLERTADAARGAVDDATTAIVDEADAGAARDTLDRCDEAVADVAAVRDSIDGATEGGIALVRALDLVERTAECGRNVAEAAVRAAMRERNA
ncbi:AbrB family transcriptional regulator [Halobacteriales archaeon QS_8_69_26]|nr:MAG: AbrB family transcriptional regulator [Halobacteriales archaeon QS_8_69_26]